MSICDGSELRHAKSSEGHCITPRWDVYGSQWIKVMAYLKRDWLVNKVGFGQPCTLRQGRGYCWHDTIWALVQVRGGLQWMEYLKWEDHFYKAFHVERALSLLSLYSQFTYTIPLLQLHDLEAIFWLWLGFFPCRPANTPYAWMGFRGTENSWNCVCNVGYMWECTLLRTRTLMFVSLKENESAEKRPSVYLCECFN